MAITPKIDRPTATKTSSQFMPSNLRRRELITAYGKTE
jgi:hypothetical protein